MPLHKDPRYCHAHGVTSALQARFHGQVLKCAIGLLMIETIPLKRPSFLRDGSLGNEVAEGCAIGEKDVRRPSLSASKRATPEPMVSIKYLCEVCGAWCRKWIPACSVISTKLPGIEPDAVAGLVCCCADAAETSSRATRLLQLGIIAKASGFDERDCCDAARSRILSLGRDQHVGRRLTVSTPVRAQLAVEIFDEVALVVCEDLHAG
jgi:hypothetical protein